MWWLPTPAVAAPDFERVRDDGFPGDARERVETEVGLSVKVFLAFLAFRRSLRCLLVGRLGFIGPLVVLIIFIVL